MSGMSCSMQLAKANIYRQNAFGPAKKHTWKSRARAYEETTQSQYSCHVDMNIFSPWYQLGWTHRHTSTIKCCAEGAVLSATAMRYGICAFISRSLLLPTVCCIAEWPLKASGTTFIAMAHRVRHRSHQKAWRAGLPTCTVFTRSPQAKCQSRIHYPSSPVITSV